MIMPDRIEKTDPNRYRVQESGNDHDRRNQQDQPGEEEPKKKRKDQFGKEDISWRKLVPEMAGPKGMARSAGALLEEKSQITSYSRVTRPVSLKRSYKEGLRYIRGLFFLGGLIDPQGRPKIMVILVYASILSVIFISTILIFRILWP